MKKAPTVILQLHKYPIIILSQTHCHFLRALLLVHSRQSRLVVARGAGSNGSKKMKNFIGALEKLARDKIYGNYQSKKLRNLNILSTRS
jgi:hypothetical protein